MWSDLLSGGIAVGDRNAYQSFAYSKTSVSFSLVEHLTNW